MSTNIAHRSWFLLAGAFALVSGCTREQQTAQPSLPTAAAPVGSASSAAEALDRMDGRSPVPLLAMMANHQKQNMRDHLAAVQDIVSAIAADDYAAVEKAARRIGSSEEMGRMCTHMGAGAPGFSEEALGFHRTADRITAAAREHKRAAVLTELGATLQTCTSCHAKWKQQVVDEATWQKMTSSAPPSHGEH